MKNTTINTATLTYRQLKELVPEAPRTKKTVKKLKDEEILIAEKVQGTMITIYKNGYLTCIKNGSDGKPYGTVYSVHRCRQITYQLSYSTTERQTWSEEEHSVLASRIAYRKIDGQDVKFHIINESEYLDLPWWFPILAICEDRIRHNEDSREEYRSEFSMDGGDETEDGEETDEVWKPSLAVEDNCEAWVEAKAKKEQDRENHEKLMDGMKTLTEIQHRTIDLYYSNPGITERDIAKELGVGQSTVHRNLQAALKKLRKTFDVR